MNNPKEEANRLVDRFKSIEHALICIDEIIISALSMKGFKKMYPIGFIEHWEQVKKEITTTINNKSL